MSTFSVRAFCITGVGAETGSEFINGIVLWHGIPCFTKYGGLVIDVHAFPWFGREDSLISSVHSQPNTKLKLTDVCMVQIPPISTYYFAGISAINMSSKAKNNTARALHRATELTGNVKSRELTYMYHKFISRDTIYLELEPHPFSLLKCLLRFSSLSNVDT